MMLKPIQKKSAAADLLTDDNFASMKRNPELAMLMTMPGGLRVLFVNYLWIRSQDAHQEGRHYTRTSLPSLSASSSLTILACGRSSPGIWLWNVSVTTFTPDQRWQWVYNG
jgi:hypothetical protein